MQDNNNVLLEAVLCLEYYFVAYSMINKKLNDDIRQTNNFVRQSRSGKTLMVWTCRKNDS